MKSETRVLRLKSRPRIHLDPDPKRKISTTRSNIVRCRGKSKSKSKRQPTYPLRKAPETIPEIRAEDEKNDTSRNQQKCQASWLKGGTGGERGGRRRFTFSPETGRLSVGRPTGGIDGTHDEKRVLRICPASLIRPGTGPCFGGCKRRPAFDFDMERLEDWSLGPNRAAF